MTAVRDRESAHGKPHAGTPLIAHVIYHLGIGGLENGLVNLINSMPESRYRHAVVCLAGYSDFSRRIRRDDVELVDLRKKPGKDPACYLRCLSALRRLRPAIVHTRNIAALDCQFVAAAAGVRARVHSEHGWDARDLHGTRRSHVRLRRVARPLITRYVTVSSDMRRWLETVIRVPSAQITSIYNGLDTERFRPDTSATGRDRFVIGTVGRLDPVKDQRSLVEAVARVLQHRTGGDPEVELRIVGDGPLAGELRDQVRRLDLDGRVFLTGATEDVPAALREFDVFVLPSLNEGTSNTILEAMATALPVIATRVGGNPELVCEGQSGFLVEPGNAEAMAGLIRRYMREAGLRRSHGEFGRQRVVDRFSLATMVREYTRLYDAVLGDSAVPVTSQE